MATEWRFGRGWTETELAQRLTALANVPRNFDVDDPAEMTTANGWNHYRSSAALAREPEGAPIDEGFFHHGCIALRNFQFSDPAIVTAHFDPSADLHSRRMLLELKAVGLRYLCGVAIGAVRSTDDDEQTVWGYRYDTLEGHIERGAEWFLLSKSHATGEIRYEISARWRPGQFPNWWSRLGFSMLGRHYQRRWHVRAHQRLALLMTEPSWRLHLPAGRLAHTGPQVTFEFERGVQRS